MKITLSSGFEIELYPPPVWKTWDLAAKKHPIPEPPVVSSETVTGETVSMTIDDDPAYLKSLADREDAMTDTLAELNMLFAMRDLEVPEDFSTEAFADEMKYVDSDWAPREGKMGRKLDYIEYVLLAKTQDRMLVQGALNNFAAVDEEEVSRVRESFQD